MGQQIRKVTKRRRRIEYLKRKKEQSKLNSNAPIRLAVAAVSYTHLTLPTNSRV